MLGSCRSARRVRASKFLLLLLTTTALAFPARSQDVPDDLSCGQGSQVYSRTIQLPFGLSFQVPYLTVVKNSAALETDDDGASAFSSADQAAAGDNGANGGFDGRGHTGDAGGTGMDFHQINCGTLQTNGATAPAISVTTFGGRGGDGGNGGDVDTRTGDGGQGGSGGDIYIFDAAGP